MEGVEGKLRNRYYKMKEQQSQNGKRRKRGRRNIRKLEMKENDA